jgi:hypothetical protein
MARCRAWWLDAARGSTPRRRLPLDSTQMLGEHPRTTPVPAYPLAREEDGRRALAMVRGRVGEL